MLKLSDLHNHSFERQIAGEFGNGVHKEIIACVHLDSNSIEYLVKENRILIMVTSYLSNAIDKYNSL